MAYEAMRRRFDSSQGNVSPCGAVVALLLDMQAVGGSNPSRDTGHWSPHPCHGRPGRGHTRLAGASCTKWVLLVLASGPSTDPPKVGCGEFNSPRGPDARGTPESLTLLQGHLDLHEHHVAVAKRISTRLLSGRTEVRILSATRYCHSQPFLGLYVQRRCFNDSATQGPERFRQVT